MPAMKVKSSDLLDTDISFELDRLFDPYNLDHIPIGSRLDGFKSRDLAFVKHYKAAVNIFGGPPSRKRIINAPAMETPIKHRLGLYFNKVPFPEPPVLNSPLRTHPEKVSPLSKEELEVKKENEIENSYKEWIEKRRKLRSNLDKLGLSEDWLIRKPDKTPLEVRLLNKMRPKPIEREETSDEEEVVEKTPKVIRKVTPKMDLPTPHGLKMIAAYLHEQKMRLVDLFSQIDKNRNGSISHDEFREVLKSHLIPITDAHIEELICILDNDNNFELDYQELARGMEKWRRERRQERRARGSFSSDFTTSSSSPRSVSGSASLKSGRSGQPRDSETLHSRHSGSGEPAYVDLVQESGEERPITDIYLERENTQSSTRSECDTPRSLYVPDRDVRLEALAQISDEAKLDIRKREKMVLSMNEDRRKGKSSRKSKTLSDVIKVGNSAIDNHSVPSTLGGETGILINKFRDQKLKEYLTVCQLCEQNDVTLSKELLERVLLYPQDKPYSLITKKVRTQGMPLLSSNFADPPKRPKTPLEVKHKDRLKRSQSGKLLIDSRHAYPLSKSVTSSGSSVNLSTGRAQISSKVNCWMTFEEYEKHTRNLSVRYQQLHGTTDGNAFWPGHLLDKIRLCMPPYNKSHKRDGSTAIFRGVTNGPRVNVGYHNDLRTWPVNDAGCVQYASYDPYWMKY